MKPNPSIPPLPEEVKTWLSAQAEEEREAMEEVWRLVEHARPVLEPNATRKADVKNRLLEETTRSHPSRLSLVRPLRLVQSRPWLSAAAVILVLILANVVYWGQTIEIQSPLGQGTLTEVQLPDGSHVELSNGTTLSYPRIFGLFSRSLSLDGEAYFDVVKTGKTFTVATFNARTRVLGTRFNVRSWSDADTPTTDVFVASGVVEVSSLSDTVRPVRLEAGLFTHVFLDQLPSKPDTVSTSHALAWRKGGLAFRNAALGSILDELQRRYDVIILADPEIRSHPSAYWKHDVVKIEEILADLTQMHNLRYRPTAQGFEVFLPAE